MKWIIALLVSAAMFFAGYHHASRYEKDEPQPPSNEGRAEGAPEAAGNSTPTS